MKLQVQTSHFFIIYGSLEARKPQVQSTCVLWGFAYKSPAHIMWTTIGFTEKLSVDFYHKGHIVLNRKTPLQQQFDNEYM